ncbi:hypothetical protein [Arsenophonus nasoniae]|uniref:Uncharacterized protein n=1 Tax=Arsenophonus nasoniae TaxID=638 RepID=A0A4P7L2T9_9GAMM|nr:hypothetical protein [Arsenophonus nasoniae]QBY47015.1 hypothetical protein ArsFIN_56260 [Arsenophonus nasoniae]WGM09186.1 hypothetical protein QE258_28065 [Arsenophonus nasoniae]
MPITIQETIEYREKLGIKDIPSMTNDEYRETFTEKTWLFYVDHHDFIRSYFTGEILAASKEQIDVMIELLKDLKNQMED